MIDLGDWNEILAPLFQAEEYKKIRRFLDMSLKCYNVPQEEIDEAIAAVGKIDLEQTAKEVMNKLFSALEMAFGFKFNYNEEN